MLITRFNVESIVDGEEELKYQKEKQKEKELREQQKEKELQEQKRCQQLRLSIEEVICKIFSYDELKKIQLYKDAIFSYLKDNGKLDLANDKSSLATCIDIYYRILKGEKVGIHEYVFLQSFSRTSENEIVSTIRNQYSSAEDILSLIIPKKDLVQIKSCNNIDLTGEITSNLLKKFQGEYSEILSDFASDAIKTMIYLQSNTNFDLESKATIVLKKQR